MFKIFRILVAIAIPIIYVILQLKEPAIDNPSSFAYYDPEHYVQQKQAASSPNRSLSQQRICLQKPLLIPPLLYSFNVDEDDDSLYDKNAHSTPTKLYYDIPILEYKKPIRNVNESNFEQPIIRQLWNEMLAGGPLTWMLLEESLEPIEPSSQEDDDESEGEFAGKQYVIKKLMLGHGGYPEFMRHVNDPLKSTFGILRLQYNQSETGEAQKQKNFVIALIHWQGTDVSQEEMKRSTEIVAAKILDYFEHDKSISHDFLNASTEAQLTKEAIVKHIAGESTYNQWTDEKKQAMLNQIIFN